MLLFRALSPVCQFQPILFSSFFGLCACLPACTEIGNFGWGDNEAGGWGSSPLALNLFSLYYYFPHDACSLTFLCVKRQLSQSGTTVIYSHTDHMLDVLETVGLFRSRYVKSATETEGESGIYSSHNPLATIYYLGTRYRSARIRASFGLEVRKAGEIQEKCQRRFVLDT